MPSSPSVASWGWTPAVAHTPSCADATAMAWRECSASVPTVTMRLTPAARASATVAAASVPAGRWQWLSVQRRPAIGSVGGRDAGEERVALLDREAPRVAAPGGRPRQPLVGRRAVQADAPPHLGAGAGHGRRWPGSTRCAASRGHRPAPRRPRDRGRTSTARWPRGTRSSRAAAARWRRARWRAARPARPRPRRRSTRPRRPASGLSARGAGPTPSHFLATTVATRASRLPRLLARSLL